MTRTDQCTPTLIPKIRPRLTVGFITTPDLPARCTPSGPQRYDPGRAFPTRPGNPGTSEIPGNEGEGRGVDSWWSLPHASGRPLTRGCVASISTFESGEASRRCRSVVKESAQ